MLQRKCYDVAPAYLPNGRALCGEGCPACTSVDRGELPKSLDCSVRAKDHRLVRLHISLLVIRSQPAPLIAHVLHRVEDRDNAAGDDAAWQRVGFEFTPREQQALRLVAEGLSNTRIAERLVVSRLTIRNHVQHILTKCGAHSRAEAVSFAFRSRLL